MRIDPTRVYRRIKLHCAHCSSTCTHSDSRPRRKLGLRFADAFEATAAAYAYQPLLWLSPTSTLRYSHSTAACGLTGVRNRDGEPRSRRGCLPCSSALAPPSLRSHLRAPCRAELPARSPATRMPCCSCARRGVCDRGDCVAIEATVCVQPPSPPCDSVRSAWSEE